MREPAAFLFLRVQQRARELAQLIERPLLGRNVMHDDQYLLWAHIGLQSDSRDERSVQIPLRLSSGT